MNANYLGSFERLHNYNNNGQDIEQSIRFWLTGTLEKADNIKATDAPDCLQYQIKSARATVCTDCTVKEYLKRNKATLYLYGTQDGKAYEMTPLQFEKFVELFGTLTRESGKNGGKEKVRLKYESKALLEWLTR